MVVENNETIGDGLRNRIHEQRGSLDILPDDIADRLAEMFQHRIAIPENRCQRRRAAKLCVVLFGEQIGPKVDMNGV